MVLIHFTASWAKAICDPHRAEVRHAADELGLTVVECDTESDWDTPHKYGVFTIPSVAIDGRPGTVVPGARPGQEVVERLRPSVT